MQVFNGFYKSLYTIFGRLTCFFSTSGGHFSRTEKNIHITINTLRTFQLLEAVKSPASSQKKFQDQIEIDFGR